MRSSTSSLKNTTSMQRIWFLTTSLLAVVSLQIALAEDAIVTLRHGGMLQGKRLQVDGEIIDQFFGIPYAKPPVGELRFQKPEPSDPWTGVKTVSDYHHDICPQAKNPFKFDNNLTGNEDCLYLDITVPNGVDNSKRKTVMVWIHGGAYAMGNSRTYVGAALARHGDVIVAAINYRLGVFGFLTESANTGGNFGLWDQRAAIMWIKENIAEFGGDPQSITIFGESAGGGSVAAQMLGQHNEGLFQRGICQSGSLYQSWSWYLSEKKREEVKDHISMKLSCEDSSRLYECLRGKTVDEIWTSTLDLTFQPWHPTPDNDFFLANVNDETYDLSQRYDVMAGFNGQEGGIFVAFDMIPTLTSKNVSVDDGFNVDIVSDYLIEKCAQSAINSAKELCANFVINHYGLDEAKDGQERVVKMSYFFGELHFNADITHLIRSHVNGNTKTYAYTFTDYVRFPENASPWYMPQWAKMSADHADEIAFVFGLPLIKDVMFENLDKEDDAILQLLMTGREHFTEPQLALSKQVMTIWTNFAKTGNPNEPVHVGTDQPVWPAFDNDGQKFLEIGERIQVIDTPEKERLDKLLTTLFPARRREMDSEKIESNAEGIETAALAKDEL